MRRRDFIKLVGGVAAGGGYAFSAAAKPRHALAGGRVALRWPLNRYLILREAAPAPEVEERVRHVMEAMMQQADRYNVSNLEFTVKEWSKGKRITTVRIQGWPLW